jgi:DNA adenine methylase
MEQNTLFDLERVQVTTKSRQQDTLASNRYARGVPSLKAATGSGKTHSLTALAQQQALFGEIMEEDVAVSEIAPEIEDDDDRQTKTSRQQLLKWIGNKQRFAKEIVSYFPTDFQTYFEPFLGSGAVWGALEPRQSIVSDAFAPLVEIWQTLQSSPKVVKQWYEERWYEMMRGDKVEGYEKIKASYNARPNGADLLFLCRSCYGGVVRFRKKDGYMSTPCGAHKPMPPENFARRVEDWATLASGTTIARMDYSQAMHRAQEGDLVYCDPPYSFSQAILYGAQSFSLAHLFQEILACKSRGVRVALSIDGTKRSGNTVCNIPIPDGLFEREVFVNCGHSMLKRFQMDGKTMEDEQVADRLLLTY